MIFLVKIACVIGMSCPIHGTLSRVISGADIPANSVHECNSKVKGYIAAFGFNPASITVKCEQKK